MNNKIKVLGYFMDTTKVDPINCEVYREMGCSHIDNFYVI